MKVINKLGIELDDELPQTNKLRKKYKYSLVSRDGTIISQSDSKSTLTQIALNSKDKEIANAYIVENN